MYFPSSCRKSDAGDRDGSPAGGGYSCGLGECSENVASWPGRRQGTTALVVTRFSHSTGFYTTSCQQHAKPRYTVYTFISDLDVGLSTKIFIRKSISCCTHLQNEYFCEACVVYCVSAYYLGVCDVAFAHVPLCSLFEVWHAGETSQSSPASQHSWPWSEDWEHARFPAPKQESGQSLATTPTSCQVQSHL